MNLASTLLVLLFLNTISVSSIAISFYMKSLILSQLPAPVVVENQFLLKSLYYFSEACELSSKLGLYNSGYKILSLLEHEAQARAIATFREEALYLNREKEWDQLCHEASTATIGVNPTKLQRLLREIADYCSGSSGKSTTAKDPLTTDQHPSMPSQYPPPSRQPGNLRKHATEKARLRRHRVIRGAIGLFILLLILFLIWKSWGKAKKSHLGHARRTDIEELS